MKKNLQLFLLRPEKFELFCLIVFLVLYTSDNDSVIKVIQPLFLVLFTLLGLIYLSSLILKIYPNNPNAQFTFRTGRISMTIGVIALILSSFENQGIKALVLIAALSLAIIPFKSTMIDKIRPGKSEIIRISLWLLVLSSLLYVIFSKENFL